MKKRIQINKNINRADKIASISFRKPIKIKETKEKLKKPKWMKIKLPLDNRRIQQIKLTMRKNGLHSVCEEASCPNLSECFNRGTATFMILGIVCTRRCPFCDITHGRPFPPDPDEPKRLAETIKNMKLNYVVITSVDRDDLRDGGAQHFSDCTREIRLLNPGIKIEILVPDFRGRMEVALNLMKINLPDIFNHNLETIPRLYSQVRPSANYEWSLKLLKKFNEQNPNIPTKSGLMMGLGETKKEIIEVLKHLRNHEVSMLTIGQYLAPSQHHLSVKRYITPEEFKEIKEIAIKLGFTHAACGPFIRSSYHADLQAKGKEIT
ncbi:lipoyl synthase [Candidatus Photodesmus katoptron]|uniref:Lipoyl synthase n=1 Tax=Candidatus Photodesmus katoptron Akat1 TaxID=1236703 RepID=S3DJQ5_9GAMM|nr:lipoyl synthase [Candidatus Photodesmus katoptron]EPE37374.1 lipoic acid synthetase [Candidatus Photodesmus katoptron Akat1]KEY90782.1 lipoyl synthase [Candidatus Photodesmus katoptron]